MLEQMRLMAAKFLEITSYRENIEVFTKDPSNLDSLMLFTTYDDKELTTTALQALLNVSKCESAQATLRSQLGLVDKCNEIVQSDAFDADLQKCARDILRNIAVSKAGGGARGNKENVAQTRRTARRSNGAAAANNGTPSHPNQQSFFTGVSNKKARTVTLQINGLDGRAEKKSISDALVRVRGVISFTFEMKSQRVVLRCRSDLRVEKLADAVLALSESFVPHQVVKGANGVEKLKLLSKSNPQKAAMPQRQPAEPDYLDEEEAVEEVTLRSAIVKTGADDDNAGGWWSSAQSYVSRALYW